MGKAKKKAQPVQMKQEEKPMIINMRELQHKAHPYIPLTFRGGAHMTSKDRPRQKKFYREDYE